MSVLRRIYGRVFGPIPLRRLSATHALSTCADAFFAVSLAGSLFFNVSIGAAPPAASSATSSPPWCRSSFWHHSSGRSSTGSGRARRLVAASTCLGRGILCLFVSGDLRNLLLYPEAFGILVLEKGYSVTKSALVPTLVDRDADLVGANSQLSRISTVAGLVGGAIAVGVLTLGNASQVLRIAALVYFTAAGLALRIPPDDGVRLPPDSARTCGASLPRDPVRGVRNGRVTRRDRLPRVPRCVRAQAHGFADLVLRGDRRGEHRRRSRRDRCQPSVTSTHAPRRAAAHRSRSPRPHSYRSAQLSIPSPQASPSPSSRIALTATMGRQGFDSILQRDAPAAARGRSFARFETLFQLVWVIGALGAVVLQPTTRAGLTVLGVVFVPTLIAFLIGSKPRGRHNPHAEATA